MTYHTAKREHHSQGLEMGRVRATTAKWYYWKFRYRWFIEDMAHNRIYNSRWYPSKEKASAAWNAFALRMEHGTWDYQMEKES